MATKEKMQSLSRAEAIRTLEQSGRNWAAIRDSVKFQTPAPLFDQPMEISIAMLRGLRMVDETIVVHGDLEAKEQES